MLTADVQWFTGLPLGGATIDLLSSADSYAWWTLFGTSTAWHFVSSWKRTLVSCVTVEHTPPLFCFLGDWVPPHDHINRMGNVHTCITWSHEQKWDCRPWFMEYQNIFWVCWAFVRVDFYPWGFCPMVFLSIGLFLCPTTWSYEQNLNCAHLYHVISWTEMGLYSLIVGVLNCFLFWGFCPLWFLSFGALVLWCFLCPLIWSHEQNVDCPNLYCVIVLDLNTCAN